MAFKKIVAIVVSYRPEQHILFRLLGKLSEQVNLIAVIDNGSGDALRLAIDTRAMPSVRFIPLSTNLGIATAQNIGVKWAKDAGADYVILFDQDSDPESNMVSHLLHVAESKLACGVPLASVGPRYFDERQENPPPFIRVKGLTVERQPCKCIDSIVEVDYLIASGCLIPVSALDEVGWMREELFIDYVDIEWGLRAKHHGLKSFGVCAAMMRHDLGDEPITFFGRKVPLHSPLRHYYHFRNAVWMYRQNWLPLHWKIADGWRLVLKYGFYALFAKPRLAQLKMMTLGIWHGLRNRMGILIDDR